VKARARPKPRRKRRRGHGAARHGARAAEGSTVGGVGGVVPGRGGLGEGREAGGRRRGGVLLGVEEARHETGDGWSLAVGGRADGRVRFGDRNRNRSRGGREGGAKRGISHLGLPVGTDGRVWPCSLLCPAPPLRCKSLSALQAHARTSRACTRRTHHAPITGCFGWAEG
jgi:hypothetical protein